ncbi:hypothetical protein EIN_403720 [Entamoeba invadens IP1]|uniref:Nuclear speckle splicing regulatory protein 1 N-terminal domain-containing protein n=1 Tax=Entamoeba invadens IP1 TaxID=370355 RepID=A0A0A1U6J2_ENTIV|nr:hypothetical protein EIN_403720 [Entamoeba invadens IP1]ELP90038.1 hypothetical protein EIN_403720 [Entamoeba invadens IP1]|eukprot:XP_004256809.1 hypothetical protein EIN_403720 [Entamoeba invadens IP1]
MKSKKPVGVDEIADFDFDGELEKEKKMREETKPRLANRMLENAQIRRQFLEETKNKRNARLNDEEEKLTGKKFQKFETKSYQLMKEKEKKGKEEETDMAKFYSDVMFGNNTMMGDFLATEREERKFEEQKKRAKIEKQKKEEKLKSEKMIAEIEKQRGEIEIAKTVEQKREEIQLQNLMKSKNTKETVLDAKQRYLLRKQQQLN